jgi:N-acetylglucosamine-6-phosphate deacetylase
MKTLLIEHADLYLPQGVLADEALLVMGDRIVAVGAAARHLTAAGGERIDGTGLAVAPGFIDMQLNGGFGHDFTAAPESIWAVAERLPTSGVTAFLPTIITAPLAQVRRGQAALAGGAPAGWRGAQPLGLHCEGPFLNPARKGAHNPAHLRLPDEASVADWAPENGVRLVTLAPELPGALDVVRLLAARGVVVSAGHSMATFAEAEAGFAAGITYATHLFNAMPPLEHRQPNLPGAVLGHPRITAGLIPDGIHVHPALVRMIWYAKGAGRVNVVTDAMGALGMPPGRYVIADQEVIVTAQDSRLPSGTLAGATITMDEALRRLMAFTGATLAEALPSFTSVPADLLRLGSERGRLLAGARADLVLLTKGGEVQFTIIGGEVLYRAA